MVQSKFNELNTIIQDLKRENQTLKQTNYELETQISNVSSHFS